MKFKCMQCAAGPCFLGNKTSLKPYFCPYPSSKESKWKLLEDKKEDLCNVCGKHPIHIDGECVNCCH